MFIVLIWISLMLIMNLFFKKNYSITCCGIFGFSAVENISADQTKLALNKIKILGAYNEKRGGQGAGIFLNNKIIKCGEKHKTFPELIENNLLQDSKDNHIIIGHCRKMSRGVVSYENTHPFMINDNLIGVHNGTIENIQELCKAEDLVHSYQTTDSYSLFRIIEKSGTKVLNNYKGGAALLWTKLSEPNSMWAYHGASLKSRLKDAKEEEERPLYFIKTTEGIYFSSMEESLWAIRDEEEQIPEIFPHNRVIKIKNGRFINSRIKIDRGECNLPYQAPATSPNAGTTYTNQNTTMSGVIRKEIGPGRSIISVEKTDAGKPEPKIWRETAPPEKVHPGGDGLNFVYFHQGRFHNANKSLCEGKITLMKKGLEPVAENNLSTNYYFYRGVMLRGSHSYNLLMDNIENGKLRPHDVDFNFAYFISAYSEYPVTNLCTEAKNVTPFHRFRWYHNEKVANGAFTAKFGGRNYSFSAGLLKTISSPHKDDKKFFEDSYDFHNKEFRNAAELQIKPCELPFPQDDMDFEMTGEFFARNHTNIFDRPILDVDAFYKKLTPHEAGALMSFTRTSLRQFNVSFTEAEVDEQLTEKVGEAYAMKQSIRQVLGDTNKSLDLILETLKNEKETEDFQEIIDWAEIDREAERMSEINSKKLTELEDAEEISFEEESEEESNSEFTDYVMENVLDNLKDIKRQAEELSVMQGQFPATIADKLTQCMDSLLHNLAETAEEHKQGEILTKINNSI